MSLISDASKTAEVFAKASTGDETAMIEICIFITFIIFAWLVTLTIKSFLDKRSCDRFKESMRVEFKNVRDKCEDRYTALAKVETHLTNQKETLTSLQKEFSLHETATQKDIESINGHISNLQNAINGQLIPDVKKIDDNLNRVIGFLSKNNSLEI